MLNDTKNFSVNEFKCHCGCGRNEIHQAVIDMCQKIRTRMNEAIHIKSGYRCPQQNANVGGVKNSFHVQGLAADLSCTSGAKKLYAVIADMKARGELPELEYAILYITKNFVHVDCGTKRNLFFEIRP